MPMVVEKFKGKGMKRKQFRIILDALKMRLAGKKAWSNHSCVLQYRGREEWLRAYKECLEWYVRGDEAKTKFRLHQKKWQVYWQIWDLRVTDAMMDYIMVQNSKVIDYTH